MSFQDIKVKYYGLPGALNWFSQQTFFFALLHKYPLFIGSLERSDRAESGSHILDTQNPIFSFRHNFTKQYFFSKVRLIPDSDRSDLSKEPIKMGTYVKAQKKKVCRENLSQASGAL